MSPKCYVPVIPAGEHTQPNPFFGYDQENYLPYVLEITLEEYGNGAISEFLGMQGMMIEDVFIHPFSIFPCLDQAMSKIKALFSA